MDFENNFKRFLKENQYSTVMEEDKLQVHKQNENETKVDIEETDTSPEITQHSKKLKEDSTFFDGFWNQCTFANIIKPEKYTELEIIYHEPKYELSVGLNPKYENYTLREKLQKQAEYIRKYQYNAVKIAKLCLVRAPYSNPIVPSAKYTTLLEEEDLEGEMKYVSRSGRQIKRKNYAEMAETESDSSDSTTSGFIKKNKVLHPKGKKQLFSRSNYLFEKLKSDEVKSKKQQKIMEEFEKTLPIDEPEEIEESLKKNNEDYLDSLQNTSLNNSAVSKTIKRRPIKKLTPEEIEESLKNTEEDESAVPKTARRRLKKTSLSKDLDKIQICETETDGNLTSNHLQEASSNSKRGKGVCPICSEEFLLSKIESHASSCGIYEEVPSLPI